MLFVPRSVAISALPSAVNETWAGSASALLSGLVEPGSAVSFPVVVEY
jgi:hypothetical protein